MSAIATKIIHEKQEFFMSQVTMKIVCIDDYLPLDFILTCYVSGGLTVSDPDKILRFQKTGYLISTYKHLNLNS